MIRPEDIRAAKALLAKDRRDRKPKRAKAPREKRVNSQERERDNAYLAWVRRQPCAVRHLGGCAGPIEAAHVRYSDAAAGRTNPGMQRKPDDRFAVPLCAGHHRQGPSAQHAAGERAWWRIAEINPYELAAKLYAAFKSQ